MPIPSTEPPSPREAFMVDAGDPRTRHYGDFYGVTDPTGDGPVALVMGNCQAESLRVMLDAGDLRTIRIPAIHELTPADMPFLEAWLARTDLLIAQPVRDNYHGLALGTRQLATRIRSTGRLLTVPVVRFAGLYPTHVIVRPPRDASLTPPLVEYHDLRLLLEASDGEPRSFPAPAGVRAVAVVSLAELTRRETAHGTVVLSDLFAAPRFALMRTLNHPGNPVWSEAAARVRSALGLAELDVDPGRALLDSVHAPREQAVIDAWELDETPVATWRVGGRTLESEEIREAHLRWYRENPDVVAAGLARHAPTVRALGTAAS